MENDEIYMIKKTIYLKKEDVLKWEQFCEKNFKSKRVLSKVITEAMEDYIENF